MWKDLNNLSLNLFFSLSQLFLGEVADAGIWERRWWVLSFGSALLTPFLDVNVVLGTLPLPACYSNSWQFKGTFVLDLHLYALAIYSAINLAGNLVQKTIKKITFCWMPLALHHVILACNTICVFMLFHINFLLPAPEQPERSQESTRQQYLTNIFQWIKMEALVTLKLRTVLEHPTPFGLIDR